jgi:tetratricopeptide (TPR) repeat protein
MKRVIVFAATLLVASWAMAQTNTKQTGNTQGQQPPAQGTQSPGAAGGQGQAGAAGSQTQPGTAGAQGQAAATPKRPPQAKSQEEYKAFQAAAAATTPEAQEKAADDFAAKFPDSELRVLLYRQTMNSYQNANNGDKLVEMGRKILAIDPNDPQALIEVAEVLSERTRSTDLDFNEKMAEASKLASHALETIDTDLAFSPNVPPEKVQEAKDWLRATAYAILGNIAMEKYDYAGAEQNLRKAIDTGKAQPDPVNYLRLAVALDKQSKYAEALTTANQAVSMTQGAQENTPVGQLARQEQSRLKQLAGTPGSAPANQPKPAPTSPQPETPHP